ncbi:MAG TPA: alpha/beta hydrolase [Actinomycetota bacterium]|jgi:pimeloyl-ACP methyl ester carboxylesterase|nr:alpha/beta hydrolase [Actinomycetota bacterium]
MSQTTTGEVTSKDGTRIVFERTGEGPPVILVGGALSDRRAAAPFAAEFSPDFTAYAYDRRGKGDSGDTQPYAVEREVEDLDALIRDAGGRAFLFGVSSGAALALETAARSGGADKLAVYEPPYDLDESEPRIPDDFVARLDGFRAEDRRGDAVEYFMTAGVGLSQEEVAQMRGAPFWPGLEAVAHTLPYEARVTGYDGPDRSLPVERWKAIEVPVLAMAGEASPDWMRNVARAVAEALPDATYRSLPGQTHQAEPAVVVPALREFFLG